MSTIPARPLALALLLIAFGCARGTTDPLATTVTLGQPFELALGATARVPDSPHAVTFEAVPQDSRCPPGAMCVWAGGVSRGRAAAGDTTAAQYRARLVLRQR